MQKLNWIDFKASDFRQLFQNTVSDLSLSLQAEDDEQANSGLQMIEALNANIDIMQRADADFESTGNESIGVEDINQIGDYALSLIGELAVVAANHGLQATMIEITRLSMPVASWIASHNGKILQLEVVVNAVASYANELNDPEDLGQLCRYIGNIIMVIDDDIRKDLENTNPMRPWRILNLNWGIVATRSYDSELIDKTYTRLMQNIPADMNGFIMEAMQQMDIVGYPDNVRQIVAQYYQTLGCDQSLH